MTEIKAFVKKNVPTAALVLYAVFFAALAVRILAGLSAPFADAYNRTGGAACRAVFAWVTAIFPFSLAETLLLANVAARAGKGAVLKWDGRSITNNPAANAFLSAPCRPGWELG